MRGNKASNLWLKTPVGVEAVAGETPSLTGEFIGETHRGLERAQAHPLRNQHQRSPVWLWVEEGVTEIWQRVEQVPLLPLGPSPTYCAITQQWVALPWWIPKGSTPYYVTGMLRQKKNMAQMKEQIKAPKIELSEEERANISDTQFKHW